MYLNRVKLMLKFMIIKLQMLYKPDSDFSHGRIISLNCNVLNWKTRKHNIRRLYFVLRMGENKMSCYKSREADLCAESHCSTVMLTLEMLVIFTIGLMTIWTIDIYTHEYILFEPLHLNFYYFKPQTLVS